MEQNDLASQKRRQIYMTAFPTGAVFVLCYLLIAWRRLYIYSVAVGVCICLALLLYAAVLFFRPQSMITVEVSFYFFIILLIPFFSMFNLNNSINISNASMDYFGTVISGMAMWEVIFFVGAYLAIPHRAFRTLVYLFLALYLLIASINILLMMQAGRSLAENMFHWLQGLFALGITLLLILRIGRLQQFYASTDSLTGIPNRRAGTDIINAEYERASRYGAVFSVILLDIDYFKDINDSYGHSVGDIVLKKFSGLLSVSLRKADFISRWGGEEFLIVLPETGLSNARQLAERLCSKAQQSRFEADLQVTASFGVSVYKTGQTLEDIIRSVDKALYQAKQNGRNCVVCIE